MPRLPPFRAKNDFCISKFASSFAGVSDSPDPPRKIYGLKPKEFERVNAPQPAAGETSAPVPAANDVFALQRELREREIAAGLDELKPPAQPKHSRRRRDFLLLLLGGNGAFALMTVIGGGSPISLIYGFSGCILFSIGLIWVMWFVMDDY